MEKDVFFRLYNELEINYGLKGSIKVSVVEVLGMFLRSIGHGMENILTQERFQHSVE